MKAMISELRRAALCTLVLVTACSGAYPLLVFGIAQAVFPHQANGSLIIDEDGAVRGSHLIGQKFSGDSYFKPRASAAGAGYDAANSGGSNLGPISKKLAGAIQDRIAAYRTENGLAASEAVPADAVTASASGLDPHISVQNAEIQATRVSRARGISDERIRRLIEEHTAPRGLGFLGEPAVNVLTLNIALDSEAKNR